MYFLISQILVSLLFTAALGVIAGWLLRGIGVRAQVSALEREREAQRQSASALEEQLAAAQRAATPPPDTSAKRASAQVTPAMPATNEALAALRERLSQLDAVARNQAERIAELGQRLRERDAMLQSMKDAQAPAAKGPTRPPAHVTAPGELLAERPTKADRLQAISGIGPVLERVLNELGIYRFRQLARMTPDHIEWLAKRIDWFPQRIRREDWVGQARRLHRESHPDEDL